MTLSALQTALAKVMDGHDLDRPAMTAAMRTIMQGEATPAQIGAFLTALRMKGETIEEIAAAARVMRELSTPVTVSTNDLVDTCGTGGDGARTFNVSTAAAFVVAAAGGRVAKHGNRSISSRSGSADLLEACGVVIDLPPAQIARCIEEVGVGFMFAPAHHQATRHAAGPRRELAVRTIFNVLGPLTNPALARRQVIGVYDAALTEPLARALGLLDSERVMVVHGHDGLDEITIGDVTRVSELSGGKVTSFEITPEAFGIERRSLQQVAVASVQESLGLVREALSGKAGAARDMVLLNAGAAIYVAGLVEDHAAGVQRAREVIDSGRAAAKLAELAEFTQRIAPGAAC